MAAGLMKWPFIRVTITNPKLNPITAATAASLGSPMLLPRPAAGAESAAVAAAVVNGAAGGDGGRCGREVAPALRDGLGGLGRTMQELKVPMLLKLVL